MRFVGRWKRQLQCALLACPLLAAAEPFLPRPASSRPPASAASQETTGIPSRLQCTPVTPETKVPWIDVSQLPDLTKDDSYFEACSDLDTAWTTQSYPNPKLVPARTPEHEERVARFLQGVKDFVVADVDDWVGYVNEWLGVGLPASRVKQSRFSNGDQFISLHSESKNQVSTPFVFEIQTVGVHATRIAKPTGKVTSNRRSMSLLGIDVAGLCITPIDLQRAFENRPGFVFQPASVRTARQRPNPQELALLGGQWFGYQVYVFSGPTTGKYAGVMRFDFGFRPCADALQIELNEDFSSNK